jgi:uncharacterized membrane protein
VIEMALRNFVRVLGAVLLVVGLAGFARSDLLGMHLTPIHNIVHLLSGAVALYFGSVNSGAGARGFLFAFGLVYALLGVAGLFAPALVARLLGHDGSLTSTALMPDNLVHLALGAAAGIAALVMSTSRELPLAGLGREV